MDYAGFVSRVSTLMVVPSSDTDFLNILPAAIDYAELRILRELDLLSTTSRSSTQQVTVNSRDFSFTAVTFVTLQEVNIIIPYGTPAANGERVPLLPVTKAFLDYVYPSAGTFTGVPQYFTMATDNTILLGPWPDNPYYIEGVGTIRPTPLGAGNTTTTLSLYFPDLYVAAAMIFLAGYQKNYSASGDDPQQAVHWEQQYKTLSQGAGIEEARKKFQSTGMTSLSPMPVASPNVGDK